MRGSGDVWEMSCTVGALNSLDTWPVPAAAAAVVDADGVVAAHGPSSPFAWASVTKLLVALTVLDCVEQGVIDLDEPAGPPTSTVRHLLSHASGLAPDADAVLAPPGRQRIYSNRGFEVLGDLLARRVGTSVADHIDKRVCRPLGMTRTRLVGSPAHGVTGPVSDAAVLARELLRPTLVPGPLLAEATRPVFPGLSGVLPGFGRQQPNDWGLGFEIRAGKSPHWTGTTNSPRTFGHFGRSGGFLWVDPEAEIACVCLTDRDFGPWAVSAWPSLSEAVLDEFGRATRA